MATSYRNEYFECACSSPEHTLRFMLYGPDEPEVFVHVFLQPDPPLKRIWNAIKYVFGYRCAYGHFDEFILRPEDSTRMIHLLEKYKEQYEQQQLTKRR